MVIYRSYEELNGKTLELGDYVVFNIQKSVIEYQVQEKFLCNTALDINTTIFNKLGISDKNEYAKNLYNYSIEFGLGAISWPEYKENDYEAATRLVLGLFKRCEVIDSKNFQPSLYNVGDIVTVKDKYDDGYSGCDYPHGFTPWMLEKFGGKNVTITCVESTTLGQGKKGHVENYCYYIQGSKLTWCASMFKGKVEKTKKFEDAGFSFTVKDIPKDCPYHPYVIDQAIVEFSKGIRPDDITSAKDAFVKCISSDITMWFAWSKTSLGHNYWNNIAANKSFVPTDYIPTYFTETSSKISSEITNVSKNVSKTSLKIPCNYEETTLSIKKKKVYF